MSPQSKEDSLYLSLSHSLALSLFFSVCVSLTLCESLSLSLTLYLSVSLSLSLSLSWRIPKSHATLAHVLVTDDMCFKLARLLFSGRSVNQEAIGGYLTHLVTEDNT